MSGLAVDLAWASLGLLVSAGATALVLRLWRRDPVRSYRLGVAVLAAALTLPLLGGTARLLGVPLPHPARDLLAALEPEPVEPASPGGRRELPQVQADPEAPGALPYPLPLPLDGSLRRPAPVLAASFVPRAAQRSEPLPQRSGEPLSAASPLWPALLALYALGALVVLANTLRRLASTRRLLRGSRAVTCPRVLDAWRRLAAGSPLFARTRLLEAQALGSPACVGLVRPAVVLPAGHDLAAHGDVLECVLTHELVHLERRDGWVLVGEELLRALFWFHPAAWWLAARLERLRELSCDSLVVRRTGRRRRYASALVEYATWMQAGPGRPGARVGSLAAVMPWSDSRGQLTRRIEMLLDTRDIRGGRARGFTPAAVGMLFTFLWSGQLALATSSCASTNEGETETVVLHEDGAEVTRQGEHEVFLVKKKSAKGQAEVHKLVRIVVGDGDGDEHEYVVAADGADGAFEWSWQDAEGRRQDLHGKILEYLERTQAQGEQAGRHTLRYRVLDGDHDHQQADPRGVWVEESDSGDGPHRVRKVIKLDREGGRGNVFFSDDGDAADELIALQVDPSSKGKVIVLRRQGAPHESHFEVHTGGDERKAKHVLEWRSSGDGGYFFDSASGEAGELGDLGELFELELEQHGAKQKKEKGKAKNTFEWRSRGDDGSSFDSEGRHVTRHELDLGDGRRGEVLIEVRGGDEDGVVGGPHELRLRQHAAGHGMGAAGEGDVERLRRELATTRARLEAQRAEIEELRRAVEELRAKRSELLR